jgi:hypothetical protein
MKDQSPRAQRKRPRRGPGITKTRGQRLVERRSVDLFRSTDYRWRELFESADVISEGATRPETEGAVYYGSTSIILLVRSRGGSVDDDQLDEVSRLVGNDPHARTRAVRIACLEAQLRAGGPIGRVRAELLVKKDPDGVRIDVEVEARVFDDPEQTDVSANRGPGRRKPRRSRGPG